MKLHVVKACAIFQSEPSGTHIDRVLDEGCTGAAYVGHFAGTECRRVVRILLGLAIGFRGSIRSIFIERCVKFWSKGGQGSVHTAQESTSICRYSTFLGGNRCICSCSCRFLYSVDRLIVPDTNSQGNVRILDVRCNGDHCKGLHQQDLLLLVEMLEIRQDFQAREQGHDDERDGISHHRPGRYHVIF